MPHRKPNQHYSPRWLTGLDRAVTGRINPEEAMSFPPPRRTFSETPPEKGPKTRDVQSKVLKFRALALSLVSGGVLGWIAGSLVGHSLLGAFVGLALVYGVSMGVGHQAGRAASYLYGGSGGSIPSKTGYSYAEALVARGEVKEALTVYELALVDDPSEPEPYLRMARLQRDELKDLEEAVNWFRRARDEANLSSGQDILVLREITEV
ncbi:tetratricopeptide repeat protein, partial [Gemmatimonadota bacterium]